MSLQVMKCRLKLPFRCLLDESANNYVRWQIQELRIEQLCTSLSRKRSQRRYSITAVSDQGSQAKEKDPNEGCTNAYKGGAMYLVFPVIVIVILAMFICPKLQDRHCKNHYDYDRENQVQSWSLSWYCKKDGIGSLLWHKLNQIIYSFLQDIRFNPLSNSLCIYYHGKLLQHL